MTPGPDVTCLGVEYFCNEDEPLWNRPDGELIELAKREMAALGLVRKDQVDRWRGGAHAESVSSLRSHLPAQA